MSYTDHTPSPPPIDEVTTDLIGVPDIGDDETFAELIGYGSSPIESLRNAWRCEIGWLFAILSNTNPLPGTSMSVFPYQTTASQPILAIYEDFFITPNLDVAWRVRSTDWKKTPYVVSPAQCDYVNRHASSPTLADHVETDLVEIPTSGTETLSELIGCSPNPISSLTKLFCCEIGWAFLELEESNPDLGTRFRATIHRPAGPQVMLVTYQDFFVKSNLDVMWRVRSTDWRRTLLVVSPAQCEEVLDV